MGITSPQKIHRLLNAPIKRHRVAEWVRKQDTYIHCLQETHIRTQGTHRLKVKKKIEKCFMQIEIIKFWGSNTYIKQNRL